MDHTLEQKVVYRFHYVLNYVVTICVLLCTLRIASAGFSFDCPPPRNHGSIFVNPELLTATKVFSSFSDAPQCTSPGTPCGDPNYCKVQLRNASVSNMVPCCVKLTNGSSVCQCVIAIPGTNDPNRCPLASLPLVSNQIYNMSGISRFFRKDSPICGTLHSSTNIYIGEGPILKNTANPFAKINGTKFSKVGFQFMTARNIGNYYINYYIEFLITCHWNQSFVSDDLPLCPNGKCNEELPHVNILLDFVGADLDNPSNEVFKMLSRQQDCNTTSLTINQCSAKATSGCNVDTEPCCYSKKCMFPFNSANDTCPCPPLNSELAFSNGIKLACNSINNVYLFTKPNPPDPQVFVWDLDKAEKITLKKILVGRGTLKSSEAKGEESFCWFGEFQFGIEVFKGCLLEILKNLNPIELPFPLDFIDF